MQKLHLSERTSGGVGLIPINNGLLHVRRAIKPCIGELALPGGYKNVDEFWEQGIAREVFEETGILVDASTITLINVKNANNGAVIVFGLSTKTYITGTDSVQIGPRDNGSSRVE